MHKSPTDPLKLRLIGIGTCFRRLLCAVSLAHLSDDFAAHLLPGGQLGVGVHGGLDTIVQLSRAMLESYITRPLSAGLPPSHAMLLLDLTNMFNAVSRESARSALADHDTFRSLLPLFDLLYDTANACWYRTPDSDWSVFSQHEGFAQGCPLSPVFAALVLNLVLPQLNRELDARTSARGLPRTDSLSYLDDTGIFLPFRRHFLLLGTPLYLRSPTRHFYQLRQNSPSYFYYWRLSHATPCTIRRHCPHRGP